MKLLSVTLTLITAVAALCPKTIDLSTATNNGDGTYTLNGETYSNFTIDHGRRIGCLCEVRTCVRKCCPVGQARRNRKECFAENREIFTPKVYDENGVVVNDAKLEVFVENCVGFYLDPVNFEDDEFFLKPSGEIYLPVGGDFTEDYCFDYAENSSDLTVILCAESLEEDERVGIGRSIGMIISMPFLVITFLVYALMPEKNLPAKYLMCYVFSLFCAYLFLIIIQLNTSIPTLGCISLSAICIYAFMSSFCWLSVSSVDIFLTFSGIRGYGGTKKAIDRRRFLIYFSFAYGLPLIHITIILLLTNLLDPNLIGTWYHPNLGKRTCWLGDGWPNLTYFYAPMGAILVLNIVMFTITALKIRQINKDTAMLHKDKDNKKHFDKNHQIFKLYLKLMFALGINWSMEFISFLCDFLLDKKKIPEIWYLTDFCNAVYGVVIFFVFVWKPATWIMLKKRYYNFMGKHHLARAMSTTPHTQSSNYQMSHTEMTSMDERPNTQSY